MIAEFRLNAILEDAGLSRIQRVAAISSVIASMAELGSERASWEWLRGKQRPWRIARCGLRGDVRHAVAQGLRLKKKLWQTYTMLTHLESVFRSLKSEQGMSPVYHQKEERAEDHLFITVLAYQAVQIIRHRLKLHGIHLSWASVRKTLARQQRITASFKQKDGRTLHVRKSAIAPPGLQEIYAALAISASPGGIKKMIVN